MGCFLDLRCLMFCGCFLVCGFGICVLLVITGNLSFRFYEFGGVGILCIVET